MKQALLVIDYTDSWCLEKYERPYWEWSFAAIRAIAPRLEKLVDDYRAHSLGEVIWIKCCPWIKGRIHPNIERLYRENPDVEFYIDDSNEDDFYVVRPAEGEQIFEKNLYSAFSGTDGKLHSYLQQRGIAHLVIAGILSTGCVNDTICEAFHSGYKLSIVGDCVETFDRTRSQQYQQILLQEWQSLYGKVVLSTDIINVE